MSHLHYQIDEFVRRVAIRQQEVVDGIAPQRFVRRGIGGAMPAHMITFGPVGIPQEGQDMHVLSGKTPELCDLTCPCCEQKLFIYANVTLPTPPKQEYPSDGTFVLHTKDDDEE